MIAYLAIHLTLSALAIYIMSKELVEEPHLVSTFQVFGAILLVPLFGPVIVVSALLAKKN